MIETVEINSTFQGYEYLLKKTDSKEESNNLHSKQSNLEDKFEALRSEKTYSEVPLTCSSMTNSKYLQIPNSKDKKIVILELEGKLGIHFITNESNPGR
jgi:hypothetical protein